MGFEINNEPCHSGTKEEVKAYINRMLEAIHRTGNRKPVFYNVSHNEYVVEAYYETAIQGTTYSMVSYGLVSGQTQQGNFLPYIDRYDISFACKVKGFHKKARLIYEFDRQILCIPICYLAMARTFPYGRISMGYAVRIRPDGHCIRQYGIPDSFSESCLYTTQSNQHEKLLPKRHAI